MITFVSGFQRCGSSLMMQMLAAGGECREVRITNPGDMLVFHAKGGVVLFGGEWFGAPS